MLPTPPRSSSSPGVVVFDGGRGEGGPRVQGFAMGGGTGGHATPMRLSLSLQAASVSGAPAGGPPSPRDGRGERSEAGGRSRQAPTPSGKQSGGRHGPRPGTANYLRLRLSPPPQGSAPSSSVLEREKGGERAPFAINAPFARLTVLVFGARYCQWFGELSAPPRHRRPLSAACRLEELSS
ncbi:hypothetical protein NDU88_003782 [Pleurodeles waltl]|uniref:Uncharacterized protein n=1 Tax=Pleurodeles waltl TaxID=8319 RepID=A0AAV7VGX5_PLEWA|nr:hypothetical protein NDU88_003782 [Pleurodeles waltl]